MTSTTRAPEGSAIKIIRPLSWQEIQDSPYLGGWPTDHRLRLVGPADIDGAQDGEWRACQEPHEPGTPADEVHIAYWPIDSADAREGARQILQDLLDRHGADRFAGFLDLYDEHTPLSEYARLQVIDGRAQLTYPTVHWAPRDPADDPRNAPRDAAPRRTASAGATQPPNCDKG